MGLDSVEVLMALEEAFDIEIPDHEVEQVRTAGDLHDLVLRRLSVAPVSRRSLTPEEVWATVRDVLVDQLEVPPEEVTPDADLIRDLGLD